MIIPCEASDGLSTLALTSLWEFNPDEPWTFNLSFIDQDAEWVISLGLVEEAVTNPNGDLHGYADVRVTAFEGLLTIRLDNGEQACLLDFPILDVEEFLNEVDTSNAQMIIGQKLDEFLETL